MTLDEANPFCQRCKEDFPVGEDGRTFRMGFLRPIDKIPKRLWRQLHIVDWEFPDGRYLCGNCYFDLTD